jgi:aconitate hydratase
MGFFPVDAETLRYLDRTGRTKDEIDLVDRYYKEQNLFRTAASPEPAFSSTLELDLGAVVASMAGPKRPQDRVLLANMKAQWHRDLSAAFGKNAPSPGVSVQTNGNASQITDGAVVIAAITSCTNTSNPSVMIGAGLLARNAVAKGLTRKPWVKTSLAPGSRVVTDYLRQSGLDKHLDALGFNTVGYGCTTCIGNSGPLPEPVSEAVKKGNLVVSAVLSGNRNFEGRINPQVKANYLASPPLVVAYAIAGTTDVDLENEPLGKDKSGKDVFLKDIWPSQKEIADTIAASMSPETFKQEYAKATVGPPEWQAIAGVEGDFYKWDEKSTYVQEPPFFVDMPAQPGPIQPIRHARVLVSVGDSVTTDHISPAGSIKADSPAGLYLQANGVAVSEFNSYGARRGNDRVMTRGTFANIRLKNLLAPGTEGGVTRYLPAGTPMSIYDASVKYKEAGVPLVVLAGAEYGTGSSRDWAAKGTFLLGIRAVIAVSYERIHRSNLVGMGVLPLEFKKGQSRESLGLDGTEVYDIDVPADIKPLAELTVHAKRSDGKTTTFKTTCRIDTPVEVDYYRHGGILHYVLRQMNK